MNQPTYTWKMTIEIIDDAAEARNEPSRVGLIFRQVDHARGEPTEADRQELSRIFNKAWPEIEWAAFKRHRESGE